MLGWTERWAQLRAAGESTSIATKSEEQTLGNASRENRKRVGMRGEMHGGGKLRLPQGSCCGCDEVTQTLAEEPGTAPFKTENRYAATTRVRIPNDAAESS